MKSLAYDIWRGIGMRPVRSILQWLTFACGFALVLLVVGGLGGGRAQVRDTLYNLGVDVIAMFNPLEVKVSHLPQAQNVPGVSRLPMVRLGSAGERRLDREAFFELRETFGSEVRQVLPFGIEMTTARFRSKAMNTTLMTTGPGFTQILRTGILSGRFLDESDRYVSGEVNPVALDEALARSLNEEDPGALVGERIEFTRDGETQAGVVVGVVTDPIVLRQHLSVLDSQASARALPLRRLEFTNLYLPFREQEDELQGVMVQALEAAQIDPLRDSLGEFFDARGIDPYYHVMKRWVDEVLAVVDRASALMHFFWILSLAVLVVISATIAVLAVEERYTEIAICRVEGAPVSRVVTALLGEGVVLSLASLPLGWLIANGLWYGWPAVGIEGLGAMLDLQPVLPWPTLVGVASLLILTGALAYVLPAYRVAHLPPAYSLGRFEN